MGTVRRERCRIAAAARGLAAVCGGLSCVVVGASIALGDAAPPEKAPAAELPARARQIAPALAHDVATTFYPTTYMARRIAGGRVRVECPLPAETDPLVWQPDESAIKLFRSARLVVLNGASMERWTSTVALPSSRVVESAKSFQAEFLRYPGVTHTHGSGGTHSHEGVDAHTWLDPVNAQMQAAEIYKAMSSTWSEHGQAFKEGLDGLLSDFKALDARWKSLAPRCAGVVLLANHPAYGYWARRYGLKITTIDMPPDAEPVAEQYAAVGKARAEHAGARLVMLFEEEPLPATREKLSKEFGVSVAVFSPCEVDPAQGSSSGSPVPDFLSIMNANVDRLSSVLPQTPVPSERPATTTPSSSDPARQPPTK